MPDDPTGTLFQQQTALRQARTGQVSPFRRGRHCALIAT
jgi:hypothetical protein